MSVLITKSKENTSAAQLLIDGNHYTSSVHCSYYSCVQVMIHILLYDYGFTQGTLEIEANAKGSGSHVYAKNYLFKKMKDKNKKAIARDFYKEIGELKNKREKADYEEETISSDLSEEALAQSLRVNKILTNVFEIVL